MNGASPSNEAGLHRLKPFFCLCAITLSCRGISYGLFHLGFFGSSSSATGFSLLLTIAVTTVVALLSFLHAHACLIAEPRRTLRELYLVSRELLYDEYARAVIAIILAILAIIPMVSIAIEANTQVATTAFISLISPAVLVLSGYIFHLSSPRAFWAKIATQESRLYILSTASILTSIYIFALATKELSHTGGGLGSLPALLVLFGCASHLRVLEVRHWIAEGWQWAFLFLMLGLVWGGDFSSRWKPYLGTGAASTGTVFWIRRLAPLFVG